MPQYQAYPNSKTTPSRKARKGERNKIFITNRAAGAKLRRARREAKAAALEALEGSVEE